jgi:oligopeptide/dipeptide ABC transporter ATP-binding protein
MTDAGTDAPDDVAATDYAIVVEGLQKTFRARRGQAEVVAIDDVSFVVERGQTLGVVGESGSGKSTVARCLLGLTPVDAGRVEVLGRSIVDAKPKELRSWRSEMQIVFQEPLESLDPRYRVRDAIGEPLLLHTDLRGDQLQARVEELLEQVSLATELGARYPHELSGGQQQRVNIARALATEPSVMVLDEPTASLDVSVQAEVLALLVDLQERFGLTYLLISHDLTTIRAVCDRVAVMYLGRLIEVGPVDQVLTKPEHPYTEFLIGAELSVNPDVKPAAPVVQGEVRSGERPSGCVFAPRCPLRMDACEEAQPELRAASEGHVAACLVVGNKHDLASVVDDGPPPSGGHRGIN